MRWAWSEKQQKVIPYEEVLQERYSSEPLSKALNNFTTDEIPPTKSPITGKYYTSKEALRSEYRAYGYTEVGNEMAKFADEEGGGYVPPSERTDSQRKLAKDIQRQVAEMRQVSSRTLKERIEQGYNEQRQNRKH